MARPKGQDRYVNFPTNLLNNEDFKNVAYFALCYAIGERVSNKQGWPYSQANGIIEAFRYYGLPDPQDTAKSQDLATKTYNAYRYLSKVMTGAKPHQLYVFATGQETRENEVLKLRAFLAMKSIVGRGKFKRTDRTLVVARMFGMTREEFRTCLNEKITSLTKRRQFAKIVKGLTDDYHLAYYAPKGCRGFYISFVLSPKRIAKEIEFGIWKKAEDMKPSNGNIKGLIAYQLKNLVGT